MSSLKDLSSLLSYSIERGLEFVLKNENEDGGWGSGKDCEVDTSSTCHALNILFSINFEKKYAYIRGLEKLTSWQKRDGGWSKTNMHKTDVDSTADAISHLMESKGVIKEVLKGLEYLANSQQTSGYWTGYHVIDTTSSVIKVISKYITKMDNQPISNNHQLRKEMKIKFRNGVSWILNEQNEDGGWGPDIVSQSTNGATADVIRALMHIKHQHPEIVPAINKGILFLNSRQKENGPWTRRDIREDIDATADCTEILLIHERYFKYIKMINRAIRWLIEQQCSDGGWGRFPWSVSTVEHTCDALRSLLLCKRKHLGRLIDR